MGPDEFSDPIIIPITITIPNPVRRRHSGRFDLGPTHHPSFTDPGWFTRQGVFGRAESPSPGADPNSRVAAEPARRLATVAEFRAMVRQTRLARLEGSAAATTQVARTAKEGFDSRLVHQELQVAALPPYAGPPLPPEIREAFDDLALTAQELANDSYLNHPEMLYASPAAKGTVLHADFYREVKSMNNPRFRLEYSRRKGEPATQGERGSIRNDVEYIDPATGAVLAIFDYKTTADPDVIPGDMLSIGTQRTRQIREALSKPGTRIDASIPIVGMRIIVPVR